MRTSEPLFLVSVITKFGLAFQCPNVCAVATDHIDNAGMINGAWLSAPVEGHTRIRACVDGRAARKQGMREHWPAVVSQWAKSGIDVEDVRAGKAGQVVGIKGTR